MTDRFLDLKLAGIGVCVYRWGVIVQVDLGRDHFSEKERKPVEQKFPDCALCAPCAGCDDECGCAEGMCWWCGHDRSMTAQERSELPDQ